jgi:hypothetical protein
LINPLLIAARDEQVEVGLLVKGQLRVRPSCLHSHSLDLHIGLTLQGGLQLADLQLLLSHLMLELGLLALHLHDQLFEIRLLHF